MSTNLPASTQMSPQQQRLNELRGFLTKGQGSIALAIPKTLAKHLTPERMIQLAVTAARKNPKLLECSPLSIAAAVIEASQLGLSCDGVLGEGYLVPRWSKKSGTMMASFQPGYRGLISLARRTGTVETIDAEAVFEGDDFSYAKGLNDKLEHVSNSTVQTKATLTHVWALIRFKGGGYQFKVMTKAQVDGIRARSQSPDDGPWSTDYPAMAVKTVIRQLLKLCDLSPEVNRVASLDEAKELGLSDPVEVEDDLPMSEPTAPAALKSLPKPKPTPEPPPEPEPENEPPAGPDGEREPGDDEDEGELLPPEPPEEELTRTQQASAAMRRRRTANQGSPAK